MLAEAVLASVPPALERGTSLRQLNTALWCLLLQCQHCQAHPALCRKFCQFRILALTVSFLLWDFGKAGYKTDLSQNPGTVPARSQVTQGHGQTLKPHTILKACKAEAEAHRRLSYTSRSQ